MKITLINPYELGRQPFGLAHPATLLGKAGDSVTCCDLSIQKLADGLDADTELVCIYIAMHTATRIAVEALPRIQVLAPKASLCVYGLYAPMNADLFHTLGVATVIGGEFEHGLLALAEQLRRGEQVLPSDPQTCLDKVSFVVPDRSTLPDITKYANLILPDGTTRTVGFAESTRGCKYLCRHCPVVPVYNGKFFVIPADIVLQDIRNQVAAGAEHISFGDPDFLNGPGHALRIVRAMHEEFPELTYDATIKIEHIVKYPDTIRELADTGCLFILSAVESVNDDTLMLLDKGHSREDFITALQHTRAAGMALTPTFVAFTPWTTLEDYIALLQDIANLQLVEAVAPVQLSIRLLVPAGSWILKVKGADTLFNAFDPALLGHAWQHPDPMMDTLQADVQQWVMDAEAAGRTRPDIFAGIWKLTHALAGRSAPELDIRNTGEPVPRLSENWYCCAEPTCEQLVSF